MFDSEFAAANFKRCIHVSLHVAEANNKRIHFMRSTSSARFYLFTANNINFFFLSLLVNLFHCQMKKFKKEETTVILSPFSFFTKLTLLKTFFHEITTSKKKQQPRRTL